MSGSESAESSCLLPRQPTNESLLSIRHNLSSTTCLTESAARTCNQVCVPSKAATFIILSASVIGFLYYCILGATKLSLDAYPESLHLSISINYSVPYALLVLFTIFFPLSGFTADVCCGRYKTILCSFFLIFMFFLLLCTAELVIVASELRIFTLNKLFHNPLGTLGLILIILSLPCAILGFAAYQANFIQYGLDQLIEAPNFYLGLFIHYAMLVFHMGSIPLAFFLVTWCNKPRYDAQRVMYSLPLLGIILLLILIVIMKWKHHWFNTDTGQENPYKNVFQIINFARKHKYPLQRSAFTYCDDHIPSRLDSAKERYGGPFTTEQVENVKTFFRMLIVLLSMGPVFMLEIPGSYLFFPLFGLHTFHNYKHMEEQFCSTSKHIWEIIFVSSGTLMSFFTTVVLFPSYIFAVFYLLRKKEVRLFSRIQFGIVLCLLGVLSLLTIDLIGHSLKSNISNHTQCIFQVYRTDNGTLDYPSLNMHWSVLIPPSFLLGIGPLIVITTIFEFISAQSPLSMKGLIIGVFFSIRGLFQFLNSIIVIPFSLKRPWASGEMLKNPPVTNCGFVYLLFTCVVGLIGLVLFSVAAKKYKYRRRDEGMFCQHNVEEIYDRYLTGSVDDLDR